LDALRNGRSARSTRSFTARYQDIRHGAISLGQYLCDLLVGMWVGSSNPDTLRVVSGSDARTRPRTVLEIRVRAGSDQ
jgi:hypothetical protein